MNAIAIYAKRNAEMRKKMSENENINIVTMRPEDLPQIQTLYRELLQEECPLSTMQKNYRKALEQPGYFPLAAKRESLVLGTAVGFICTAPDSPFLVVENVVVREDCRGMGVGRKLLKRLDDLAVEQRCSYSILVSSGFRKDAHRFYESAGYTDDVRGFRKYYREINW